MALNCSDPVDWTVDEVVSFLCGPEPPPWADSAHTPRPLPNLLEAALRENEMCGEVLMHVDNDGLKDLGIKAYGHRISLMKGVEWLRRKSPKYLMSQKKFKDGSLPTSSDQLPTPIPGSLRPDDMSTERNPTPAALPQGFTDDLTIGKAKLPQRRIQPILLQTDDSYAESPDILSDVNILSAHDLQSRSRKDEDFFTYLTEKYGAKSDEEGGSSSSPLPEYGESGSEGEYDEHTWKEILKENPSLDESSRKVLSHNECNDIMQEYICRKEHDWKVDDLPDESPIGPSLWLYFRQTNSLETEKNKLRGSIDQLDDRLRKLQDVLRRTEYGSPGLLIKACRIFDVTISHRCRDQWRLDTLAADICPQQTERPPRNSYSRIDRDIEQSEEETLCSEPDSISENSDSELSDESGIEQVDLESDLSYLSISSGVEDTQPPPNEPRTTPEPGEVSSEKPLSLEKIPSSALDDTVDVAEEQYPNKRPRVEAGEQVISPVAGKTVVSGPFFQNEDKDEDADMPDWGSYSLMPGSPIAPESAGDQMDISITTPPLNPTTVKAPPPNDPPSNNPSEELQPTSPKTVPKSPPSLGHTKQARTRIGIDGPDVFDQVFSKPILKIQDEQDADRLLAKLVTQLRNTERAEFPPLLNAFFHEVYVEKVQEAIRAMLKDKRGLEGDDPNESKLSMRLAALFVSWHHCAVVSPGGLTKDELRGALNAMNQDNGSRFAEFLRKFRKLIDAYDNWTLKSSHPQPQPQHSPEPPRRRSTIDISDDSVVELDLNSPPHTERGQKRKQHPGSSEGMINFRGRLPFSRGSNSLQRNAHERQERQIKAREMFSADRIRRGLNNNDPEGQVVSFKDPPIYLNPSVGRFVKPTQLLGIQFMWREICESEKMEGCMLAHIMGLGKTMQVISLLLTIAEASLSLDPNIRDQVPKKLQGSCTIVLAPAGLIQNWLEEFDFWLPRTDPLGRIFDLSASSVRQLGERLDMIEEWGRDGGVLIMGYEIFLRFINNTIVTHGGGAPLTPEEHKRIQDILLQKPQIVVADEAHRLKSSQTGVTKAVARFETKSRISMTGSPLANNLIEYFQMIDWISPGYLEDYPSFKTRFIEPIQAGLYIDSNRAERRAGLKALKLLNGIIEPKVHRLGISALAADLPPKKEFVLFIKPTPIQTEMYNVFVKEAPSSNDFQKFWQWVFILQQLLNHPAPFMDRLTHRSKEKAEDTDFSTSVDDAGVPQTLLGKEKAIFAKIQDQLDPSLSNRMLLLHRILLEAKRANDKVLIFSHIFPTLDYIENHFTETGTKYQRIDGNAPIGSRQGIVKAFNSGNDVDVMLISTKAGGVGLNMFGANRVVIFDFMFNPAHEDQAIGRAYRLGQRKPVFVYRFVTTGTFEELVHDRSVFKSQLSLRVVDKKDIMRASSRATTKYLFEVKASEPQSLAHIEGNDPEILDRIIQSDLSSCFVKINLSTLKDDEDDVLTAQEKQEVDRQLALEQLRRTDIEAYRIERARLEREEQCARERIRLQQQHLAQQNFNQQLAQQQRFQPSHITHVQQILPASTPQVPMPTSLNPQLLTMQRPTAAAVPYQQHSLTQPQLSQRSISMQPISQSPMFYQQSPIHPMSHQPTPAHPMPYVPPSPIEPVPHQQHQTPHRLMQQITLLPPPNLESQYPLGSSRSSSQPLSPNVELWLRRQALPSMDEQPLVGRQSSNHELFAERARELISIQREQGASFLAQNMITMNRLLSATSAGSSSVAWSSFSL
ncbi:SNF2 family helicase/ATPase [Penicillium herquei]|nr:SNF2 family helicase/ATPase [Penicillium herquei]